MREAVIVSTARTPIGRAKRGAFNHTHGADLGGHVIRHALAPPISLDSRLAKTAGPERKGRDGPEAEGEQGDRRS